MKRTAIASLLALASCLPAVSQAADGKIQFEGSISDATCLINGNAPGENNVTYVNLGSGIPLSKFTAVNKGSDYAEFALNLSGPQCANGKKVSIAFDPNGNGNIDQSTGNLVLIGSSAADGVQIEVSNNYKGTGTDGDVDNKAKIQLGQAESAPQQATIAGNTAQLFYRARYIQTKATVKAGAGVSYIRYILAYQ
ncbi:type I pilus biogensis protein CupB1 [Cupriavidus basilensis OR16]|uniref:Type I pilus biogensis protein CupB1 n=1 Tax=Cupriavidus basilensis OR16 TaxID=1127483 RepID=H1S7J6_9BURK|nr:fimbrial protein [Cupriavidus basilensis]EHP41410.1 type I pilus biogensis protein CupB1 [Cupriavidus basilensis OR16]